MGARSLQSPAAPALVDDKKKRNQTGSRRKNHAKNQSQKKKNPGRRTHLNPGQRKSIKEPPAARGGNQARGDGKSLAEERRNGNKRRRALTEVKKSTDRGRWRGTINKNTERERREKRKKTKTTGLKRAYKNGELSRKS